MKKVVSGLLALLLAGCAAAAPGTGQSETAASQSLSMADGGLAVTAAEPLFVGQPLRLLKNGPDTVGNGDEAGFVQGYSLGAPGPGPDGIYRRETLLFYLDYASAVQRVLCAVPGCGHDTPQCPAYLEEYDGVVWPQDGFVYRASAEGLWRIPLAAPQTWEQLAPLNGYLCDAVFANYTDGAYFYYAADRKAGTDGWNHDVLFRVPLAGGTPEPLPLGENLDVRGCWEDKLVCLRTTAPGGTFDVDSPQARNARRQNSVYELVTVRPGEAPVTVCAIKPFLRDDSAMNVQVRVAAGAAYYAKEAEPGGSVSAGLYRLDLETGRERLFLAPDTPCRYLPTFGSGAPESAAGVLLAQREAGTDRLANVALDIVTGTEKAAWPAAEDGAPVELWAVCGEEYLVHLPGGQEPGAALMLVPRASFFTGMQDARPVEDTALKELIRRKQ